MTSPPYLSAPVKPSNQGEVEGSILFKDPLFKPATSYKKKYLNFVFSMAKNAKTIGKFGSVQFSCLVMSNSEQLHGLQQTRPLCPSPAPGVYPNSCPLRPWCHPTTSYSVVPFSSCLQSCPASRSFQMSQVFSSGGQITEVSASASVLPMNIQDLFL